MMISLPPGFRTLKTSRRSVGKAGHQKCVSTAVMTSKAPSENDNRDGRLPNLNARNIDPLLVRSYGHGHALRRMIDTIDLALSDDCSQLAHGSASAAAYIQDDVLFPYRKLRKAPICNLGVGANSYSAGPIVPAIQSGSGIDLHVSFCRSYWFTQPFYALGILIDNNGAGWICLSCVGDRPASRNLDTQVDGPTTRRRAGLLVVVAE